MHDSKSESCLHRFHDNHINLNDCTNSDYIFIIKTQQQLIDMYIDEIKKIKERLNECNGSICRMKHFSDFDVDILVDSILHNGENDKTEYKNAISFMKNSIHFLLNK
jgi:hypothetical protein